MGRQKYLTKNVQQELETTLKRNNKVITKKEQNESVNRLYTSFKTQRNSRDVNMPILDVELKGPNTVFNQLRKQSFLVNEYQGSILAARTSRGGHTDRDKM